MTDMKRVEFKAWVLRNPETGKILALSTCDLMDNMLTADAKSRRLASHGMKREPVRVRVTVEVIK